MNVRLIYLPHAELRTVSHFEVEIAPLSVRITLDLIEEFMKFDTQKKEKKEEKLKRKAVKSLGMKYEVIFFPIVFETV